MSRSDRKSIDRDEINRYSELKLTEPNSQLEKLNNKLKTLQFQLHVVDKKPFLNPEQQKQEKTRLQDEIKNTSMAIKNKEDEIKSILTDITREVTSSDQKIIARIKNTVEGEEPFYSSKQDDKRLAETDPQIREELEIIKEKKKNNMKKAAEHKEKEAKKEAEIEEKDTRELFVYDFMKVHADLRKALKSIRGTLIENDSPYLQLLENHADYYYVLGFSGELSHKLQTEDLASLRLYFNQMEKDLQQWNKIDDDFRFRSVNQRQGHREDQESKQIQLINDRVEHIKSHKYNPEDEHRKTEEYSFLSDVLKMYNEDKALSLEGCWKATKNQYLGRSVDAIQIIKKFPLFNKEKVRTNAYNLCIQSDDFRKLELEIMHQKTSRHGLRYK